MVRYFLSSFSSYLISFLPLLFFSFHLICVPPSLPLGNCGFSLRFYVCFVVSLFRVLCSFVPCLLYFFSLLIPPPPSPSIFSSFFFLFWELCLRAYTYMYKYMYMFMCICVHVRCKMHRIDGWWKYISISISVSMTIKVWDWVMHVWLINRSFA